MANLLGIEIRQGIKTEYRLRILSVALLLVSFCAVAGLLLLTPAYLNARSELQTLEYEIQATKNSGLSVVDPESQTKAGVLSARAEFINTLDNVGIMQYVHYAAVMRMLPDSVTYSRLDFKAPTELGYVVAVSGFAPTRSVLANMIQEIQDNEWVISVDYPFSSLGESANISFTLDIVYQREAIPEISEYKTYLESTDPGRDKLSPVNDAEDEPDESVQDSQVQPADEEAAESGDGDDLDSTSDDTTSATDNQLTS